MDIICVAQNELRKFWFHSKLWFYSPRFSTTLDYYTKQTDYADLINRVQMWTGYRIAKHSRKTVDDINLKLRRNNGENTNLQFNTNIIVPDMSVATIPDKNANKEIINGEFTYQTAAKAYPNDYYICAVAMTGAEIKEMFEYYAEHMYDVEYDASGNKVVKVNGDLTAVSIPYGINFHYQMDKSVGNKVVIEGFANGKKFDPNGIYVVMVNNRMDDSSENYVYETIGWNRVIYDQELNQSGTYIRNILDFYCNILTQEFGGVYPTEDAEKDGEYVSKWYISY